MNPNDYERSMAAATEETARKPFRFGGRVLCPGFGAGSNEEGFTVHDGSGHIIAVCTAYEMAHAIAYTLNLLPAARDTVAAYANHWSEYGMHTMAFQIGRLEAGLEMVNGERRNAGR